MQTSFKNNSTFFDRILQIIEYKGIKSVNEFAIEHLKYNAPQKINRLKQEGNNPSYEIITDIVNKFEDISAEWLLTGKGEMLKSTYPDISTHGLHLITEPDEQKVPKVVTVDSTGKDNIVLVPVKAAAGYLAGYGDANFIQKLPVYKLPNIQHGTFRMFQVNGHSMYPTLTDRCYVVGQFVENWATDIKDDRVYVIVSKNDGVIVKRVLNRIDKYGNLFCKSDNRREHPNISVSPSDVVEVWEVKMHLSFELPNPADLYDRVSDLEAEVHFLKSK